MPLLKTKGDVPKHFLQEYKILNSEIWSTNWLDYLGTEKFLNIVLTSGQLSH